MFPFNFIIKHIQCSNISVFQRHSSFPIGRKWNKDFPNPPEEREQKHRGKLLQLRNKNFFKMLIFQGKV